MATAWELIQSHTDPGTAVEEVCKSGFFHSHCGCCGVEFVCASLILSVGTGNSAWKVPSFITA